MAIPSPITAANAIAVDRRGNIFVAGVRGADAAVAQLDQDGGLVPTFGTGGIKFVSEPGSGRFIAHAMALDAQGRVILAGSRIARGGLSLPHVALTRLQGEAVAPPPQSGWWWNPAESGRGFFLETRAGGGAIFFASYLYAANGRATWYASSLSGAAGTFAGTLDAYAGGQTLWGAYQPPAPATGAGGSVKLSFSDANHGVLAWAGGTTPIERFVFADNSNPPPFQPQRGWWWNPAESGRGFSLEVQGSTVFLSGYMYAADGSPWYLSSGSLVDRSYQGNWVEYADGQTLGGPYQPPTEINAAVGAVSIVFTSPEAGLMTLPDGRQIEIVRFTF